MLLIIQSITILASILYACAKLSYAAKLLGFHERRSKIASYTIASLACAIYTHFTVYKVPIPIIYAVAIFILFFIFRYTLEGTALQHLFASGNYIFHLLCVRGITLALISIVIQKDLNWVIHNELLSNLSLCLSYFSAIIYLSFFSSILFPRHDILAVIQRVEYVKTLIISQGVLITILILGNIVYYLNEMPLWFSFYHLFSCILIFLSFYPLFSFCIKSSALQKYKSAYHLYQAQVDKQIEAYSTQVQYVQGMRKFKHDWVKIREILYPLVNSGDEKTILSFLNQIDIKMHDLSNVYTEFSNSPMIQAILLHCRNLCREQGIQFDGSIILPNELPLNDLDLCRIFTNVINNALEATQLLPTNTDKFIKVVSSINEHWCTITCVNSFDGILKITNGEYRTRKEDSYAHGFGIKNIESLLDSCGGFILIDPDINLCIFKVKIHIPLSNIEFTSNITEN